MHRMAAPPRSLAIRVSAEGAHAGGDRGWIGDNPFIWLECSRIRALGWKPKLSIKKAVERTVDYLQSNAHLLDAR